MRNRRALVLAIAAIVFMNGIIPRIQALSARRYPDDKSYLKSLAIVVLECSLVFIALFPHEIDRAVQVFFRAGNVLLRLNDDGAEPGRRPGPL